MKVTDINKKAKEEKKRRDLELLYAYSDLRQKMLSDGSEGKVHTIRRIK